MKCIYCLEDKSVSLFTKTEHVLSQAFGTFKDNLTLNGVVCDTCNQYFGDNLELHLARDSFEGMVRFEHNVKKQCEFKSAGKQSRLSIKVNEGPFRGAYAFREYSEPDGRVIIKPVPQVGFKKLDSIDYEYFPMDQIPDKDYLDSNFELKARKSIVILGSSLDTAQQYLLERGITLQPDGEEGCLPEPQGDLGCEVTGQMDLTIFRAIAKIAFNYLSYWTGKDFVFQDSFHPIRKFIRYGEKTVEPCVMLFQKAILGDEPIEGNRRLGHLIVLDKSKNGSSIVCKVSLFNWITYSVVLARDYRGADFTVRRGQFFNVVNGDILELRPEGKIAHEQEPQDFR